MCEQNTIICLAYELANSNTNVSDLLRQVKYKVVFERLFESPDIGGGGWR